MDNNEAGHMKFTEGQLETSKKIWDKLTEAEGNDYRPNYRKSPSEIINTFKVRYKKFNEEIHNEAKNKK